MAGFDIGQEHFQWKPWVGLFASFLKSELPLALRRSRIRRVDRLELDYIGQTGVGIQRRVRMLRGIANAEMPYRDPQTAGPALEVAVFATIDEVAACLESFLS